MSEPRRRCWSSGRVSAVVIGSLLAACAGLDQRAPDSGSEVGLASYYSDVHQGQETASGERFDQRALTAAHPHLPFGSRVRVTNLANGRQIVVRINDRGPFVEGRVIDLSRRAAEALDMIDAGVVRVRLTPE